MHYLSDVVAGLCLGMAVTIAAWVILVPDASRIPHELAVLTGTGRKRVAVILNPAKIGDVDDFKARVLAVAAREGWRQPVWYETTLEDPGPGQAQAALEEGVDLIVAAGGDGTVRAVCEEAARTGVAVGILPHGTGNLLARNLGLPLNIRDALDVAFGGQDKPSTSRPSAPTPCSTTPRARRSPLMPTPTRTRSRTRRGAPTPASWSWPASAWTRRS